MISLCDILYPNDRVYAISAEIGTTVKPTPVANNVTDVVVAQIETTVSIDSTIEISVQCFF